MKRTSLLLLLSVLVLYAQGQEVQFKERFIRQGNGYYDGREGTVHLDMPMNLEVFSPDYKTFAVRSSLPKTVTIIMVFDRFNGVVSSEKLPLIKAIGSGETKWLFWLKPVTTAAPDYNYNLYHYEGHANPIIKDFSYSLPFGKGLSVNVESAEYSPYSMYYDKQDQFFGLNFSIPEREIIHAARGGKVTLIEDGYDKGDKHNRITIEHRDGTIANYIGFKKNTIRVSIGEEILMGAPLAEAQGPSDDGIQLLFTVSYLKVEPKNDKSPAEWGSLVYYKPEFQTEEGKGLLENGNEYTCVRNPKLITQDMTKKERKRYLKSEN